MFNQRAAAWAYDLVMKMDSDEAEVLVPMVMSDVFYQDIHNNKRAVNGLIGRIHKNISDDLSKLVSKGMVSGDDAGDVLTAGLGQLLVRDDEAFELEEVAKYEYNRDKEGQFASVDTLGMRGKKSKKAQRKYKKARQRFENYEQYWDRGALDLASAMDRGGTQDVKRRVAAGAVDATAPLFQREWTKASNDGSSTSQTYRRIGATGGTLASIGNATGNTQLQLAGAMGTFAGQYGPEAEKVIGPSVRRAAYRYRGVTREPDAELEGRVKEAYARTKPGTELSNEDRMSAARMGAMQYLVGYKGADGKQEGRIPKMSLAEIQRKSGRVTPSEGVMINARGEVVAQAFGHADDHYLPFNLKQLNSLNGGEYVRTRTTGGLTSEDIYTGLMAGAKRVTVVSNSGTFTVEFADNLKGVKRYGDKAQSMVTRYKKTLDTIRNGQIERVNVSPEVKAEIRDKVEEDMPANVYTRRQIQEEYDNRINEYKSFPTITDGEMDDIESLARRDAQESGGSDKAYRRARATRIEQVMDSKANRTYKLDGDGYSTALDAMHEQYPYFIKSVNFQSSTKALTGEGRVDTSKPAATTDQAIANEQYRQGVGSRLTAQEDKGYVKPKHNRPEDVLEGYYDETVNGPAPAGGGGITNPRTGGASGKIRADRTDYQNWGANPLNPDSPVKATPTEAEAPKEAKKPEGPRTTDERTRARDRAIAQRDERNAAAAIAIFNSMTSDMLDKSTAPVLKDIPTGIDGADYIKDKAQDPKWVESFADAAYGALRGFLGSDAEQIRNTALGLRDSIGATAEWSDSDLKGSIKNAMGRGVSFSGPGHVPGADDGEIEAGMKTARGKVAPVMLDAFGDDYNAALKYAETVAAGTANVERLSVSDGVKNKLAKTPDDAVLRSAQGYARMKHMAQLHGEDALKGGASSSPKATTGSASAAPATRSTSMSSSTTTTGASSSKQPSFEDVYRELDKMVGQPAIKSEVRTMANFLEVQKQRREAGLPTEDVGGHMVFLGNPGTGKTSIAQLIGKMYYAAGVLPSPKVVEVGRGGLVGEYVGQTAPKVNAAVDRAMGGVLFIDEAYNLANDTYGKEAIETLMMRMEADRGKFVVIAAGYDKNMDDFLSSNPGLRSRFQQNIKFEDYKPEELGQILTGFAARDGYVISDDAAKKIANDLTYMHAHKSAEFANGRTVRNYWEAAKKAQSNRLTGIMDDESRTLAKEELMTITGDDVVQPRMYKKTS